MKHTRNIVRTVVALFFAIISLVISGNYVAYFLSCDGMGTHKVAINEKLSCCCSDESAVAPDAESVADNGCCSVDSKLLGVDSYISSVKHIDLSRIDHQLVAIPFIPLMAIADRDFCSRASIDHYDDSPPDMAVPSGTDIIFCITRQLRI